MAAQNITKDSFNDVVSEGIALIDCWAPWCGPCKAFGPVFDAASERHDDVTFAKINTEEEQEFAAAFQIRAIPSLLIFRDGILLGVQQGALPGEALDEIIGKVKEVNMEDVKAEIARQEEIHRQQEALMNEGEG